LLIRSKMQLQRSFAEGAGEFIPLELGAKITAFRPGAALSAANATVGLRSSRDRCQRSLSRMPQLLSVLSLAALLGLGGTACAGQAQSAPSALPDAPQPQIPVASPNAAAPCPAGTSAPSPAGAATAPAPCPPRPPANYWFSRFLTGPEVKPLTPKEKARLAVRNVLDPFNALTILAEAGISVGADAHSAPF